MTKQNKNENKGKRNPDHPNKTKNKTKQTNKKKVNIEHLTDCIMTQIRQGNPDSNEKKMYSKDTEYVWKTDTHNKEH